MSGIVCSVSITERSSGSCTTAQVQWVRKSKSSGAAQLRLSSVKLVKTPPPRRTPGNAARAAP